MKRTDLEIGKIYVVQRGTYDTPIYVRLLALENTEQIERLEAIRANRFLFSHERERLGQAKRRALVEQVCWGDRDFYRPGPISEITGAHERKQEVTFQSIRSEWTDEVYQQFLQDEAAKAEAKQRRDQSMEELADFIPRLKGLLGELGLGEKSASVSSSSPVIHIRADLDLEDVRALLARHSA